MTALPHLLEALESSPHVTVARRTPFSDFSALAALVKPHFGDLSWVPPPSYCSALRAWGPFAARRHIEALDADVGFELLDPDVIASVNEDVVHIPEGVSRHKGIYLSTNHLVGFAEAGGEAVWCFDVTQGNGGEYPVYYHHQDAPRARIVGSGAWEEPKNAAPDFESFTQWLEVMTAALTAPTPPTWFDFGEPGLTFVRHRSRA